MPGSWFGILESARVLSNTRPGFTALDLKEAARIPELKEASAWLSKFAKWGYVIKVGTQPGSGKKPFIVYNLSDYGKTVAPKSSHRERLEQLILAIDDYSQARGKPAEAKAWKGLTELARELKEGLKEEGQARAKGRS